MSADLDRAGRSDAAAMPADLDSEPAATPPGISGREPELARESARQAPLDADDSSSQAAESSAVEVPWVAPESAPASQADPGARASCPRAAHEPAPASRADPETQALRLLAIREHSRLELARKLAARGHAAPAIAAALDRLTASGALDERRLAERYVAERADKGFGPLRILAELREKGVPEALVREQLADWNDRWPDCLARLRDRRYGPSPPADRAELARRQRFLQQRGFPADLIRRLWRGGEDS